MGRFAQSKVSGEQAAAATVVSNVGSIEAGPVKNRPEYTGGISSSLEEGQQPHKPHAQAPFGKAGLGLMGVGGFGSV